MSACDKHCPKEIEPFDPDSAGTIEDGEQICRGSFVEKHYSKGKIKIAFITEGQLLSGELSIYRASTKADFTLDQIAVQLRDTNPATLKEIYAAPAKAIRELGLEWSPGRFFCLVDDPIINNEGDKHRAHAVIQLCRERSLTRGHEDFIGIRNKLFLLFQSRMVWSAAV